MFGIIIGWILCAALTYAIAFAEFQSGWSAEQARNEYLHDRGAAMTFGILGPIGLLVVFLNSGFAEHGLKWR